MPLELDTRQRAMLQEMGVHVWLPGTAFAPDAAAPVAARAPSPGPAAAAAVGTPVAPRPASVPAAQPPALPVVPEGAISSLGEVGSLGWAALAQTAAQCQACGLCAGRKLSTLQPPAAPTQADWMVVGDPPDEDEDRGGHPFAQEAGVLLDNMLKAVGASRTGTGSAGAYVTNVVKCRPPPGHMAQPAELAQCAVYLQREIALVQPKVILAMGRFALQVLLAQQPELASVPLGKLRGQVYRYQGVAVVATYHPKVLLRTSADKAKAWADLCLAMDVVQSIPNNL